MKKEIVFAAPETIKQPATFTDRVKYERECQLYIDEVKSFCKSNSKTPANPYVGKTFGVPHADGKALYMVLSAEPLELVHLEIGDAWDSPFIDLFNFDKVKEVIDADEKLAACLQRKKIFDPR